MTRFTPMRILPVAMIAALLVAAQLFAGGVASAATQIKLIVNHTPITNYDIQRRMAFLKLQHKPNGEKAATDDMIEQALKVEEIKRLGIRIPDKQVEESYAKFASGNKLTVAQMNQILDRMGVTKEHFKDFIRVQIGWNQALGARYRTKGRVTEQDAVQRMLQQGGAKPTATEYMLQQVIFVVPESERDAKLAKRKAEAEALRSRFTGCEATRNFAKGLIDVTVRDLGRVLAPELPPDWADAIKATKTGSATSVRETPRGVEFIGVCNAREVSDDRVAQMVFETENKGDDKEKADEISEKYLAELRGKARIVQR